METSVEIDMVDLSALSRKEFHIFRKTNIIEFKNPDDELSEDVLWKVVGYAGFYIAKYGTSPNEITLTLLRSAKPVKMFKEMAQFVEADETKGIYHIRNWKVDFSIQVIVSREKKPRARPFSAGIGIS